MVGVGGEGGGFLGGGGFPFLNQEFPKKHSIKFCVM